MPDGLLSGTLTNLTTFLAAAGGLGTAAFGLVDVSKAVAGGMSIPGFGYVRQVVTPLLVANAGSAGSAQGPTVFGKTQILATLRANNAAKLAAALRSPWQIPNIAGYAHSDYLPLGDTGPNPLAAGAKWARVAGFVAGAFRGQSQGWPSDPEDPLPS